MDIFYGRKGELELLCEVYDNIVGPSIVNIMAPSGSGKTRLIYEFYNAIARRTESWQEVPCRNHNKEVELSPKHIACDKNLREIFLVTRALDKKGSNENYDFCFDRIRVQFSNILPSIIQSLSNRDKSKKLAKSTLSLLLNFALPGSSNLIEILNTLKDYLGGSFDTLELLSDIQSRFTKQDNNSDPQLSEVKNVLSSTLNVFNEIYRTEPSLKTVIIIEDIHWIDAYTELIVENLYKAANEKNWPILFVFSGWDEALLEKNASYNQIYAKLSSFIQSVDRHKNIHLRPLSKSNIIKLIKDSITGLDYDTCVLLYEKCRGDLDMLSDIISMMKETPGWINNNQELQVNRDLLRNMPSPSVEIAKTRLWRYSDDIKKTLYWSSLQGMCFDEKIIQSLLDKNHININVRESILLSDHTYGLTYAKQHEILRYSCEFRRSAVYQACYETISLIPNIQQLCESLLEVYIEFFNSVEWGKLSQDFKNQFSNDINNLCKRLNITDKETLKTRDRLLLDVVESKIFIGDYMMAISLCREVLSNGGVYEIINKAYSFLVDAYYYAGLSQDEMDAYAEWDSYSQKSEEMFIIKYAKFLRRTSKTQESINLLSCAENRKLMYDLGRKHEMELDFELVKSLWAHGDTLKSYLKLKELENNYIDYLKNDVHCVNYHTAAYLVLHDMEKSRQASIFAEQSIEDYLVCGNIQQMYIYKINYADSLFGLGYTQKALSILKEVIQYARDNDQPQILDIALLVQGNIYSYCHNSDMAKQSYEEGISIAKRISHDWDYIYGMIYYNLHLFKNNMEIIDFDENTIKEYVYLKELNDILKLYVKCKHGEEVNTEVNFSIPAARLHYKSILYRQSPDMINALQFTKELGQIEGCKFYREAVFETIDSILNKYPNISCAEELKLWKNTFSSEIEKIQDVHIVSCDFLKCEARCCYDGVYLQEGEADRIKQLVEENKDFFNFLPDEYIVSSSWGKSVKGQKTAVKNHEYKRLDFPSHFNKTRCVFALEDGRCSLQFYAIEHNIDQYKYKPIACQVFPIETNQGEILTPLKSFEKDKYFMGANYPGYTNYTPCGINRCDGRPWREACDFEISTYKLHKDKGKSKSE